MENITLKCSKCGSEFECKLSTYKYKKNKGQKNFFCSKGCCLNFPARIRSNGFHNNRLYHFSSILDK